MARLGEYDQTVSSKIDDEMLQILNEHDFLTSFPDGFHPISKTVLNQPSPPSADQQIPSDKQTIDNIIQNFIVKYDHFLQDHHDIIRRLRMSID